MADPQSYRPKASEIPNDPGVYRFLDGEGRIIYVGKAKNLRKRLTSYFRDPENLHPRTRQMVYTGESVAWVVVKSELEALTLEYAWIKEYAPFFNVMYRDDKSYPYLTITYSETYPRLAVTRNAHRKGDKYYGPYAQVRMRDSLDLLQRVFPVRTCTKGVFNAALRSQRPCLNGYLEKCIAPCLKRVSVAQYRELTDSLAKFLDSDGTELIVAKRAEMLEASKNLDFEKAAKVRDQIFALEKITEKNTVVLDPEVDADIYGICADELEAGVQVFYVRGGRIRGQRGWITDTSGNSIPQLLGELLIQVYGEFSLPAVGNVKSRAKQEPKTGAKSVDDILHTAVHTIPREIWLPELPEGVEKLTQWLTYLRGAAVSIRSPQRGTKAKLLDTVELNAKQALARHKIARSGDLTRRSQALEELRLGLNLSRAPLRIECYDISHLQGQHRVASMVVFEDGLAKKKDYRHFKIQGKNGAGTCDDTSAMREVLRRRLARLNTQKADNGRVENVSSERILSEKGEAVFSQATSYDTQVTAAGITDIALKRKDREITEAEISCTGDSFAPGLLRAGFEKSEITAEKVDWNDRPRFAYKPDLIVVDGGLPQVNAAQATVEEIGVKIPVIGLAKRLEEVWIPGESYPLILSRTSPALYLLQYLRDESHRFAITFHRKERIKTQTASVLDQIPGLGSAKQKMLLRKFKSVKRIRMATVAQLQEADGIGPVLARTIHDFFAQ